MLHRIENGCSVTALNGTPKVDEQCAVDELEVLANQFVGQGSALRKGSNAVKNREGVAQGPVCFFSNRMKSLRLSNQTFLLGNPLKVVGDVTDSDALKIKNLAA